MLEQSLCGRFARSLHGFTAVVQAQMLNPDYVVVWLAEYPDGLARRFVWQQQGQRWQRQLHRWCLPPSRWLQQRLVESGFNPADLLYTLGGGCRFDSSARRDVMRVAGASRDYGGGTGPVVVGLAKLQRGVPSSDAAAWTREAKLLQWFRELHGSSLHGLGSAEVIDVRCLAQFRASSAQAACISVL